MSLPGRSVVLVSIAGLLSLAGGWDLTSSPVNLAAAVLTVAVLGAACWRPAGPDADPLPAERAGRGIRLVVVTVLVAGVAAAAFRPATKNVTTTTAFWVGFAVLVVATVLTAASALRRDVCATPLAWSALGSAVAALALIVAGSARPRIDVWVLLQTASSAVWHGRNPYVLDFPGVPDGQTAQCFTYLPGSFLLGVPGRLVGDVRYAELAVLVAGWILLTVAAGHGRRPALLASTTDAIPLVTLAAFALVLPATARVIQQSWTDSLLVGLLLAAVALVLRGHPTWAMLPLALALATKQHVALVLPLVLLWWGWRRCLAVVAAAVLIASPWIVAAPDRMWTCGVRFFLDLPATHDSISFWRFLPGPIRLPSVLLLTVFALVICWRRVPRTPAGFLLATAFVNAAFDLANKQSYLNQWWFVAQLTLAAVVAGSAPGRLTAVTTGTGTTSPVTTASPTASRPPTRRAVLRIAASAGAVATLSGCSVVKLIGGPGTATGSPSPTPFTPRPTVIGTPVAPLQPGDTAVVEAAIGLVVDAVDGLAALARKRPDLAADLAATAAAHDRHLAALAALSGTAVPRHSAVTPRATSSAKPGKKASAPKKPTEATLLGSAASIEHRLNGSLANPVATAADAGVAALVASVAASAGAWQAWFKAAATSASRSASGG